MLSVVLLGCAISSRARDSVSGPRVGPIENLHAQQNPDGKRPNLGEATDTRGARLVTEISLERSSCYGRCPCYTVTLLPDGLSTYEGYANTKLIGRYVGAFKPADFAYLAAYIDDIGFFEKSVALFYDQQVVGETAQDHLGRALEQPAKVAEFSTDQPSCFVSVVRSGIRKTVQDYGECAPFRILVLEDLIDRVRRGCKWRRSHGPTKNVTRQSAP